MKKLLKVSSWALVIIGIVMFCGGIWGAIFISQNVSREKIVTPEDASVPGVPVLGPATLKVQADTIRKHTLVMTGGKTYAEMPRQITKLDPSGAVVIGEDNKPVMVANTARDIWVTATTLVTALNLGIISYILSGLVSFLGLIFVLIGSVFCSLSKR